MVSAFHCYSHCFHLRDFRGVTHLLMVSIAFGLSCSICTKKQNRHFIVPKSQFTLLQVCVSKHVHRIWLSRMHIMFNYTIIMFHRAQTTLPRTHLTHTWPSTHSAKLAESRVSTLHVPTLMDMVSWIESRPLLGGFYRLFLAHGKTDIVYRQTLPCFVLNYGAFAFWCEEKVCSLIWVFLHVFWYDFTGVAPHCLDPGTVRSVTVEDFCGETWEESMQKHQTIRSMSKPTTDT